MSSEHHASESWLPLSHAAELLGSTHLNVLMHVKRGLLTGAEREGGWLVDPGSVAALLAKRRTGAAPMVCGSGCAKKTAGCGGCS